MVGVIVTFRYEENDFDVDALRQIATGSRVKFEGMPGLRSKTFTIDSQQKRAVNVYVWDTSAAAEGFFTQQFTEMMTGVYGVRPEVRFVEIASLVDNGRRSHESPAHVLA